MEEGERGEEHNTPCRQAPSFIHSFIHFIHALLTCVVCVVVVVVIAAVVVSVVVVAPSRRCCCCCFCHSLVETSVFLPRVQKGFLFFLFFCQRLWASVFVFVFVSVFRYSLLSIFFRLTRVALCCSARCCCSSHLCAFIAAAWPFLVDKTRLKFAFFFFAPR